MIDNLKIISPLIKGVGNDEDAFLFLQLIQRKKENPELGSNSKVIKNYYINNLDYLLDEYNEIKQLCNTFNARAMLRLNKRSYRKVALRTIQNVANSIANGEYAFVKKSYDRACGQGHNDKVKKWIVDIDFFPTSKELRALTAIICFCAPSGKKVFATIPSIQGMHLITSPFNLKDWEKHCKFYAEDLIKNPTVHKDNPTNLYIP